MPIRWGEIPHAEVAARIYFRLEQNAVNRSAEDSLRHILYRRLRLLGADDHGRFIELEARGVIEHLRCTRDAYRNFIDKHNCHPILEAYWVVLHFAVFPTAIAVLRGRVIDYIKATRVPGRDLSLLFGIPTHSCYRTSDGGIPLLHAPDFNDETPASHEELRIFGNLVNEDTVLWFRDIRDDGAVGCPLGGGPFAVEDALGIHRSWNLCAMREEITVPRWIKIREKLWRQCAPWTDGLFDLFGSVQEELLSQWRALPRESGLRESEWNQQLSRLAKVAIPQLARASRRGRPKSKIVADRQEVIRRIAATGLEGERYCLKLDEVGLCTPVEWQKRDECPKRYGDAWNDPRDPKKWRQRIANEKSKATTSDNAQVAKRE